MENSAKAEKNEMPNRTNFARITQQYEFLTFLNNFNDIKVLIFQVLKFVIKRRCWQISTDITKCIFGK